MLIHGVWNKNLMIYNFVLVQSSALSLCRKQVIGLGYACMCMPICICYLIKELGMIHRALYTVQKVLGQLRPLLLRPFLWSFYSETLSVSPSIWTSGLSFVLKGISHIVNFSYWHLVWKYLIIQIRSFKDWMRCNILSTKLVFFNSNSGSFKLWCRQ